MLGDPRIKVLISLMSVQLQVDLNWGNVYFALNGTYLPSARTYLGLYVVKNKRQVPKENNMMFEKCNIFVLC